MVVSVSGGSPRFLMSDSRSAMIFLKVRKSSCPFITDCACRQVCACLQSEIAQGQTAGVHCSVCAVTCFVSNRNILTQLYGACSPEHDMSQPEVPCALLKCYTMARTGRNCMYFLRGLMKRLIPSLRPAHHHSME
jgi:hypothetical protein